MRKIESYLKEAKICWIIAGIFFGIALICHILVFILTLLGYE
jgi:type IV secretory pathway component VirB8